MDRYASYALQKKRQAHLNEKHQRVVLDETFGDLKLYRQGSAANKGCPIVSNGAEIQAWSIEDARKLYEDLSDLLDHHDKRLREDPAYAQMIKDYEEG
ncbi:hypothetical protein SEA_SIENNA_91 [Gordonia phage Sienna]|uniref:Uncharacterized protein n=1 Tax=Gordonia phage Sienna TaxID=2759396 RepID=A0A7L7SIW3_9CAUD|nr:hypothetical protein SEA_SIENNA_91 [Gordonia phage Sienna]